MNTVCSHCLATNRVPDEKISDSAKCGRCKEPLFEGEIINATEQTLDKLLQDDLPVVIDFGLHGVALVLALRRSSKMSRKSGHNRFVLLK